MSHVSYSIRWGLCGCLLWWLWWGWRQGRRALGCWPPSPCWTAMQWRAGTSPSSTTSTTLAPGMLHFIIVRVRTLLSLHPWDPFVCFILCRAELRFDHWSLLPILCEHDLRAFVLHHSVGCVQPSLSTECCHLKQLDALLFFKFYRLNKQGDTLSFIGELRFTTTSDVRTLHLQKHTSQTLEHRKPSLNRLEVNDCIHTEKWSRNN